MKKLTVLIAGTAGYVLGTRAGRERYEQIKTQATKVWNNPKVQDTVETVQEQAKTSGSDVASKVAETAGDVKTKVSGSQDDDQAPSPSHSAGGPSL